MSPDVEMVKPPCIEGKEHSWLLHEKEYVLKCHFCGKVWEIKDKK